ncbi:DMT family transporter [Roseateles depolymerans]|uniref:Putative transmembrane protein n=1 Tax=Roseateles depolymerans TaxID=76731 RepID=A0A0U3LFI1_9BURK|nr:DMT family transporter [Roseateles depolymerans]ALV06815.1 Putative transmembrane protein [Roseateles depolymerans]REG19793.1 drug/metabolite transporter (DMT)-like permease [Roseateles depolymerans]
MKQRDLVELTLLAAIWGASFLFMRIAAPEFGPVATAFVRVAGASLLLMPLLFLREGFQDLRRFWPGLLLVGLLNGALPFALFSFAALSINAGLSSILNATTPMWGALVAWIWFGQRLDGSRLVGLALGFTGVVILAWDKASFKPGGGGFAILAVLLATLSYGVAANATKRFLSQASPLAVATGSQFGAALLLALPALLQQPAQMPSLKAWGAVALLALLCTSVAYILFFRLMKRVGPTNTIAVTFLIPVFALIWGFVFLHETLTTSMALGCLVVLLGTGLAVGVLRLPATPVTRPAK